MLVNIWATVVHLSDAPFAGVTQPETPSLDLLLSESASALTDDRQIWMVDTCYRSPGTLDELLRASYSVLRAANESYLLIVTPGYADLVAGTNPDLWRRQLTQLARRGRAFNKRLITTQLPVPEGCPQADSINAMNAMLGEVLAPFDGVVADLRDVAMTPWSATGSVPVDGTEVAERLSESILNSHCGLEQWQRIHD